MIKYDKNYCYSSKAVDVSPIAATWVFETQGTPFQMPVPRGEPNEDIRSFLTHELGYVSVR
jgi:hypothetical protein